MFEVFVHSKYIKLFALLQTFWILFLLTLVLVLLRFLSRICFIIVSLEHPSLLLEARMGPQLVKRCFSAHLFLQYPACASAVALPPLYGAVCLSLFFLLDLQGFLMPGIHFSHHRILSTPSTESDSWVALKKYRQYVIKFNVESVCLLELQECRGTRNLAAASAERRACPTLGAPVPCGLCDRLLAGPALAPPCPGSCAQGACLLFSQFPLQVAEDFETPETKPLHPLKIVSLVWVW